MVRVIIADHVRAQMDLEVDASLLVDAIKTLHLSMLYAHVIKVIQVNGYCILIS